MNLKSKESIEAQISRCVAALDADDFLEAALRAQYVAEQILMALKVGDVKGHSEK